ncbi:MAG: hypothetical protein QOH96_1424, partial [Blastocatellia bacterium]|nr:hypothetical protein [Blastocatellia bacterium]
KSGKRDYWGSELFVSVSFYFLIFEFSKKRTSANQAGPNYIAAVMPSAKLLKIIE